MAVTYYSSQTQTCKRAISEVA